jgi:predicted amidophosphoribosyltransferase
MPAKKKTPDSTRLDNVVASARREQDRRALGYRERALKLYPWVCGRCAREFTHANLQELTVHHRNGDHDDNPEDGSNWELLCLYCHDNEHSRYLEQARHGGANTNAIDAPATFRPFAGLDGLLKGNK